MSKWFFHGFIESIHSKPWEMQLLRSESSCVCRSRDEGGSLVRGKQRAEELTSEEEIFSALNYQQFQGEKMFICTASTVSSFFLSPQPPSTLALTRYHWKNTLSPLSHPHLMKLLWTGIFTKFQDYSWIFQWYMRYVPWSIACGEDWLDQHVIPIIFQWCYSSWRSNLRSTNLTGYSCQPSQWWENIGCMLKRVIGDLTHSERGSKMIPTCRFALPRLAVLLLLICSIPRCLMSLIRKQLQTVKHKYVCTDCFGCISAYTRYAGKHWPCHATHILYLSKLHMALSGISVRANCAEDNVSNNRLNPISQTYPLEVSFR